MAVLFDLDPAELDAWLDGRPKVIHDLAKKFPPNRLYKMDSGHRCTIYSYCEDGTVTVDVSGKYNRVIFSRQVFGVNPETMTECELPMEGEDVGDSCEEAGLNTQEIKDFIIPAIKENKK